MVSIEIILIFLCQLFGSYSYKVIKSSFNFKLRPFYGNIEEKAFNKNQLEFMHKDECIAVDWNDNMIGSVSKKDSHIFSLNDPRGKLHRAFSVFLFNSDGKLLLQQRAKDKITFPGVWTNTCCSHPLVGMIPDEVDSIEDVLRGNVNGIKHAACRKLEQELGIKQGLIDIQQFKYLTRLHYWAADVVTHGPKAPWGEHEIDYILFAQIDDDGKSLNIQPNPEEVEDIRWVDFEVLQKMMIPDNGLLWSPWFRIAAARPDLLPKWWSNLHTTLTTDTHVELDHIHRFDPSSEHMGGLGDAGPYLNQE